MTITAPTAPTAGSSRRSLRYGPEFVLPHDTIECRTVYRGVEALSPKVRYGIAEPRVFTPPLRELTPETTWGFAAVNFAENVLELTLFPWQRWLLIHLLELDESGQLRFQTAVVLIARQNGKSTLSQVLALFFMIVRRWPLVLGTAQDLTTAEEVWDGGVELLQSDDELSTLIERVIQVNGKKALVLAGRIRWLVKAASRKAGRGFSGNLILMDELREQHDWAAWGAITKTTQAQEDLLIFCLSNAGDITSVVLRHLRMQAHAALGDPDGIVGSDYMAATAPTDLDMAEFEDEFDDPDDITPDGESLFIAEWSAAPGTPVNDRYGWSEANPSLGHRIRIRKLAADSRTDPEWTFRTEVMCQWPDAVLDGPFPAGSWDLGKNTPVERVDGSFEIDPKDILVGDLVAAIDQSMDRATTYVCVAGRRADGAMQVELWAARTGTDWVKAWLQNDPKTKGRIRAVTGQTRGAPVSPLMLELKTARESAHDPFRIDVVDWQGGDLMISAAEMFDAVRDVQVHHNPQPPLDIAAATAVMKTLGDGFVLDRRNSLGDVAPLMAFCGALWMLQQHKPKRIASALPLDDDLIEERADADDGALTGGLYDLGF